VTTIDIHSGTGESRARDLNRLLDVAELEPGLFEGQRKHGGVGRVYGGEVVAQALAAASKTVPADRIVHSLHAYFLRGGSETSPSQYRVEADFDGRSFSNRRVIASQQGEVILNLAASFHKAEPGHHHQMPMPAAAGPDSLLGHQALIEQARNKGRPERGTWTMIDRPWPVEIRPVIVSGAASGEQGARPFAYWFRAAGHMDAPQWMHRVTLSFVSDLGVLSAAALPHDIVELQGASIDHSIWFHADVDMNQWMLYDVESPWSGGARGMGIGHIFGEDGRLIATVAQEGLMRDHAFAEQDG
jgi:acyl-CoA thioesterase-2